MEDLKLSVKSVALLFGFVIGGVAAPAGAASRSDTMTNIVTLADSCAIMAVGIDFGFHGTVLPPGGITGVTLPNTATGNAQSGNSAVGGHPLAGKDSGKRLALATGLPAFDSDLSRLLAGVPTNVPGVFVACTAQPTSITVASPGAGTTASLPLATRQTPMTTLAGKMTGIGGSGAAGSANSVDYLLSFEGVLAVATPGTPTGQTPTMPTAYIGTYTATGRIPPAQTGVIVPGYYADVVVATVNF